MSQDYRLKLSKRPEEFIKIIETDKIANSATYQIQLQDHTLGDLVRIFLLKNEQVKFAGYRLPHPLQNILQIKVQTNSIHPNQAMKQTLMILQKDLLQLQEQFEQALTKKASYHN